MVGVEANFGRFVSNVPRVGHKVCAGHHAHADIALALSGNPSKDSVGKLCSMLASLVGVEWSARSSWNGCAPNVILLLSKRRSLRRQNVGGKGPDVGQGTKPLLDAKDLDALAKHPVLVSCQGGDYTTEVYPRLRSRGWSGYFIDAASTLRMNDDAVLILDPVNLTVIESGLRKGIKTFVGANCTVSLMLMAICGLFRASLVEWLSSMTYQAASGAGAANMWELALQMQRLGVVSSDLLADPASSALSIERVIGDELRSASFPTKEFGAPLAASLIPWIEQTRRAWSNQGRMEGLRGNQQDSRNAQPHSG